MDDRPHPGPNAPHTWMGFSTGRWDGDMLIVETTHLKQGWIRRNGIPMSDRATMTEYIVPQRRPACRTSSSSSIRCIWPSRS